MKKDSATVILLAVVVGQFLAPSPVTAQTSVRITLADVHTYLGGADLGDGDWLYFDLAPATMKPTYRKKIKLANFTVIGDYSTLEWQTAPTTPVRTFERLSSKVVDDLFLSVFEVKFPAAELRSLGPLPMRFDAYHVGAAWPFRVLSSALPKAKVVRINDRVQYSSHVVNIAVPITWDEIVPPGDRLADVKAATLIFYEHFEDAYEDMTFVMTRSHRRPVGAHLAWVLDVEGINMPTWNARAEYGGSSVLMGGNAHVRGDFLWNAHTIHETGHQWGFWFDLFELAGTEPMVSDECWAGLGHAPLVAGAHTFLKDSCIPATERDRALCIKRRSDDTWALAQCDLPLTYHPFQLYAMGLLEPADVPPLVLRLRQDMPQPYRAGTPVEGPFAEIPIEDVIARYGPREGPPMPPIWRRAVVVLSPDRLLPAKELTWFNFFAKRVSDPDLTGIEGLDRTPSLEFATRGLVDLRTEIRPLVGAPIDGSFATSYPRIGKKDFPGVKLDKTLGTLYRVGKAYRISGRILEPGSSKKVKIVLGSQTFKKKIKKDGRFTIRLKPASRNRGPQPMVFTLAQPEAVLGTVAPVYVE